MIPQFHGNTLKKMKAENKIIAKFDDIFRDLLDNQGFSMMNDWGEIYIMHDRRDWEISWDYENDIIHYKLHDLNKKIGFPKTKDPDEIIKYINDNYNYHEVCEKSYTKDLAILTDAFEEILHNFNYVECNGSASLENDNWGITIKYYGNAPSVFELRKIEGNGSGNILDAGETVESIIKYCKKQKANEFNL